MNADSDSSSSDDERTKQIKEAAITVEQIKSNDELEKKYDGRNVNRNDNFDDFNATPEFQNHVAKKLGKLLDDSIEIVDLNGKSTENNEQTDNIGDFVDFKLTKSILYKPNLENKIENEKNLDTKKEKRHLGKPKDKDNDKKRLKQMCEEAAISADDIFKSSCINEHKKQYSNETTN